MVFLVIFVALLFVFFAIHIVLGWILPRDVMTKIYNTVDVIFKLLIKILVVLIGFGILYVFIYFFIK